MPGGFDKFSHLARGTPRSPGGFDKLSHLALRNPR